MNVIADREPTEKGCYTFDVTKGRVINQINVKEEFETKVTKYKDIIDITLDLENTKFGSKVNGIAVGKSIDGIEESLFFDQTELELL